MFAEFYDNISGRFCKLVGRQGENRKSSKKEIKTCAGFRVKSINLINPKIIATLGTVALEALKTIEYHQFALNSHAAKILSGTGGISSRFIIQVRSLSLHKRRAGERLSDFRILRQAIEINEIGAL